MCAAHKTAMIAATMAAAVGAVLAAPSPLTAQALERLEAALEANPIAPTEPGYLGVITDDREDRGFGVRVMEVIDGGPAQGAGVEEGDLIVAANDRQVRSMDDLAAVVQTTPAGGRIAFDLLRGRQMMKVTVTLTRRPAPGERRFEQFGPIPAQPNQPFEPGDAADRPVQGEAAPREPLGITVGPVTAADRQRLNLGPAQGVLVVEVLDHSAAAKSGIRPDDLILSIGGIAVTTADEIADQLNRLDSGPVGMVVLRQGRPVELLVRWPAGQPADDAQPQAPQVEARRPGVEAPRPQPPAPVQNAEAQDARIRALEQRVAELEAQLRTLQQQLNQRP